MDNSTLITVMGVCIAIITGIATIITLVVGFYAIYLQRTLVNKTKQEFQEHFHKMLDMASQDPSVLQNFIKCVVEKEEFKDRFLELIRIETENILDSRQVIETIEQNYKLSQEELKAQNQFQNKE